MARSSLRRYFRHGMLTQLLVFAAVARAGSVTRAAAELHLAQPTVSMQLRKLSEALDMPLFEREGRGLRLTECGRAVHELCDELAGVLARAEMRFDSLRKPVPAKMRLLLDAFEAAANNPGPEEDPWKSRGATTRQ